MGKQAIRLVGVNTRSIEDWVERISGAWREQVPSIFETGNLLEAAKLELKENGRRGEWLKMVKEQLPFGSKTAVRLMAIADNENLRNGAHAHHLPPVWTTLYELTKLTDEQFATGIKKGTINPRMERKDVNALRGIEPKPRKKKSEQSPSDLSQLKGSTRGILTDAAFALTPEERREFFEHLRIHMENIEREFTEREKAATNAIR